MTPASAQVERTARDAFGRLLAYLAARSRDLVACEDALADAFLRALETWPERGIPDNPDAWLLAVARRRLVDAGRHHAVRERAVEALLMRATESPESDERLPLLFVCAHPAIDPAARTPLMLQVVLGMDAATIARSFLVSPASMAKRLVRAKQKIKRAGIPFEVPGREDWRARLGAVLDAVYAAFSLRFDLGALPDAPTVAEDRHREALHLAEVVATLLPDEPEAQGLFALLSHVEARRAARTDGTGTFVPLEDQDPARWDAGQIDRAERALRRAAEQGQLGRYQLEAAIQSAWVARVRHRVENHSTVVELYDALWRLTGTLGAALGHAAAVGAWRGAHEGLACLDRIRGERLEAHQPYWAVRAELLARVGAPEADGAYERAIELTSDRPARRWLEGRRGQARS